MAANTTTNPLQLLPSELVDKAKLSPLDRRLAQRSAEAATHPGLSLDVNDAVSAEAYQRGKRSAASSHCRKPYLGEKWAVPVPPPRASSPPYPEHRFAASCAGAARQAVRSGKTGDLAGDRYLLSLPKSSNHPCPSDLGWPNGTGPAPGVRWVRAREGASAEFFGAPAPKCATRAFHLAVLRTPCPRPGPRRAEPACSELAPPRLAVN
ncbi:hypothetical protein TREES_T100009174 [Tupaia chinensis]|uniref:Uncharacterized protein n=1 Tax=Tupaia chinensis TaxID=246437 RepID=L9KGM7_TUPCH|nr:hypothetical protein TREES_T100009174 [Tupaia chinensis]